MLEFYFHYRYDIYTKLKSRYRCHKAIVTHNIILQHYNIIILELKIATGFGLEIYIFILEIGLQRIQIHSNVGRQALSQTKDNIVTIYILHVIYGTVYLLLRCNQLYMALIDQSGPGKRFWSNVRSQLKAILRRVIPYWNYNKIC